MVFCGGLGKLVCVGEDFSVENGAVVRDACFSPDSMHDVCECPGRVMRVNVDREDSLND